GSARVPLSAFAPPIAPLPPSGLLFPYTTLFRSVGRVDDDRLRGDPGLPRPLGVPEHPVEDVGDDIPLEPGPEGARPGRDPARVRSEEHTSELQSRFDLVCRLLLEKKNKNSSLRG